MAKNIFIASTKRNTGKSVVCLGLISALRGIVSNVGYFKPIGQRYKKNETFDKEAIMIKTLFNINDDLKYINPFSIEELNGFIMNDEGDVFFQKLQQSYKHIEKDKDIVIIDGIDNVGMISTFEFDINADIANNMAATVLLVEDGYMKSVDEIVSDASMGRDSFAEQASDFMGVIVNKVQNERFSEFEERLKSAFKKQNIEFFGAIPYDDILPKPRIYDIARCLEADILFGEKFLSNIAVEPLIASMEFENALKYITEGALIITGGDRNEILLGSFVSLLSPLYPNISGIILTGGLMPNETMIRLIKSMPEFSFPIISVKSNTLETTNRIKSLAVKVTSEDDQKIDIARTLIYKHIDFERINTILKVDRKKKRTPEIFKYEIIEKACSEKKRIVLPETGDERILRAVEKIRSQDIADIILLGDPDSIINKAMSIGVSLNDKIEIIDPLKSAKFENYMNTYLELRKHKNYTEDIARDMMQDSIYFGTMMIYKGDADGLVAGAVNTTRHTIKPAFEIIKTKQNISVASSVFLMCLKDMVILYGDCAINPNPNAEELAEIAISSVDTALAFDIEPFVAMLSYSTGESGKGPEVEMVKKATEIAKKRRPDIPIEGPIQYDAAIDPEVAKIKLPDSPVAGKATVFIFPDLNTGNNTYKAVQRSAGAIAIGPVIQGLNKPVNDLSRGCLVDDIVYTVAMTAIQAQEIKT